MQRLLEGETESVTRIRFPVRAVQIHLTLESVYIYIISFSAPYIKKDVPFLASLDDRQKYGCVS